MPELFATIEAMRDKTHNDRKFAAALKGIDLDGNNSAEDEGKKKFAEMKAKVLSGGRASADDLKLRNVGTAHKAVTDSDGIEWWKM